MQKESWKSVQQRHGQTQHPLTDVNDRICNRRSPAPSPTDGHHQDEGENFHLRRRSRLCNDSSLRRAVPPRRMARRGQPESLRSGGASKSRWLAHGCGWARERARGSSARPRVTSGGSWAAPELLGAPAANPSSPGAAAGSRRLCWSDNPHPSAGSRDPLGPGCCTATSNPPHAQTHTHTHTQTRRHKHTQPRTRTNPLGRRSPRSPQQWARLQ